MYLNDKIDKFLNARKINYISSYKYNEVSDSLLLEIPVERIRKSVGHGFTSHRQINNLVKLLEREFNVRVIVSLRKSKLWDDLESGLRALLTMTHNEFIDNVTISSTTSDSSTVWVFISKNIDAAVRGSITELVTGFIKEAKIGLDSIGFIDPKKQEPSPLAILRAIKIESPIKYDRLMEFLIKRDYYCTSAQWLLSRLDTLRKKKFIIRNSDGSYALTSLGLSVVPSSSSKSSSDVERILSLAKRRVW